MVVVDGVAKEVGDDLGEPLGVSVAGAGKEAGLNLDAACSCEWTDEFDAIGRDFGKVAWVATQWLLAGVEARQFEERFDEATHAMGSPFAGFECFAVLLRRPFTGEGGLRLRKHHRHWRA